MRKLFMYSYGKIFKLYCQVKRAGYKVCYHWCKKGSKNIYSYMYFQMQKESLDEYTESKQQQLYFGCPGPEK